MMDRKIERRKDPRIGKSLPLKITSLDKYDVITETKNISASGAYCNVDFEIPELTKLDITILVPRSEKIPPKKINCQGVVVRIEKAENKTYNIAIYFHNISKSDKKIIKQYIEHHIK